MLVFLLLISIIQTVGVIDLNNEKILNFTKLVTVVVTFKDASNTGAL